MHALITAAGLGTRARLPNGMRKEMLPIYCIRDNNIVLRPIIDEIMHKLYINIKIEKFFVVLNKNDHYTMDYINSLDYKTEIIYQEKPLGYGNAVGLAKHYINGFFVLNAGDGIIINDESIRSAVKINNNYKCQVLAIMRVNNPERYGIAGVSKNKVQSCVEKPQEYIGRNAMAAFYILNSQIFDFIDNENITSAIDNTIKNGFETRYIKIRRSDWISVGSSDSYYKILAKTYKNVMISRRF